MRGGKEYYIIYIVLMFLVIDIRGVQTVRFESDRTCMLNVKRSFYPEKYRTFCHMSYLVRCYDHVSPTFHAFVEWKRLKLGMGRVSKVVQHVSSTIIHAYIVW